MIRQYNLGTLQTLVGPIVVMLGWVQVMKYASHPSNRRNPLQFVNLSSRIILTESGYHCVFLFKAPCCYSILNVLRVWIWW